MRIGNGGGAASGCAKGMDGGGAENAERRGEKEMRRRGERAKRWVRVVISTGGTKKRIEPRRRGGTEKRGWRDGGGAVGSFRNSLTVAKGHEGERNHGYIRTELLRGIARGAGGGGV